MLQINSDIDVSVQLHRTVLFVQFISFIFENIDPSRFKIPKAISNNPIAIVNFP